MRFIRASFSRPRARFTRLGTLELREIKQIVLIFASTAIYPKFQTQSKNVFELKI